MKNKPVVFTVLSLAVLIMISCSLSSALGPAPVSAVSPTSTSTDQPTPAQSARQSTKAPVLNPPVANATAASNLPLSTPVSAGTSAPCDKATLVSVVSVPDGTVFHPGDPVVKTWRLMNAGSCTWTTAYRLIFDRGYNFLGVKFVNLAKPVAPGQTADISLKFPAPTPPGTYESFWNLQGPAGTIFGLGENGAVPLNIRIVVQAKQGK